MTEKQICGPRPNRIAAAALIEHSVRLDPDDPEFADRIEIHEIPETIADDIERCVAFDDEAGALSHPATAFLITGGPADQWLADFGPKRFYGESLADAAEWIVEQQAECPPKPANGNSKPDPRLDQWPTEKAHLPFLDHLKAASRCDWIVYHTGGGCSAYMIEIETAIGKRQILVSIEADAATEWVSAHKDFPWIACAYDDDGDWTQILIDPDFKRVAAAVASWITENEAA
jgi:hypothetical protein